MHTGTNDRKEQPVKTYYDVANDLANLSALAAGRGQTVEEFLREMIDALMKDEDVLIAGDKDKFVALNPVIDALYSFYEDTAA